MSDPTLVYSLTVKDAAEALEFYARAFGAKELYRFDTPDGAVLHAEFVIGNSHLNISNEYPDWQAMAMDEGQTASFLIGINTENCDEAFQKAIEAGATAIEEPKDQIWGVRTGIVRDPFGYRWNLRQLVEDVSPDEMMRRFKEMIG